MEGVLVDAFSSLDGLVPVQGHGMTFEYAYKQTDEPVEQYNNPRCKEYVCVLANNAKKAVIEKD